MAVFEWLEDWYHEKRMHSAINYRSLADFEHSLNPA
jgi:hypothetical protein